MLIPELNDILNHPKTYTKVTIQKNYPEFYKSLDSDLPFREALWNYYHKRPTCPVCGGPTTFINFTAGYHKYCSVQCRSAAPEVRERLIKTNLERYGVENPMQNEAVKQKLKDTFVECYGVENPMQNEEVQERAARTNLERYGAKSPLESEEILNKIKKTNKLRYKDGEPLADPRVQRKIERTNLERYGAKNPTQNKTVIEKVHKTNLRRYGCKSPFGSSIIRKQIILTNLERYGVENPSQCVAVNTKIANTHRVNFIKNNSRGVIDYTENGDWICTCPHENCNLCDEKVFITSKDVHLLRMAKNIEICTRIQPIGSADSTGERELYEYIQSIYKGTIVRGWNGLYFDTNQPKQIDVYLPELKIGFEFNGIYYHDLESKTPDYERSSYGRSSKAPDYHFKKWKAAKELGIRLITIWDFQWAEDRENIELFIRSVLDGDRDAKYGTRVDGMSHNEWIEADPDDIVLEKQTYKEFTYVDSGCIRD